jgi:hypothetical protein
MSERVLTLSVNGKEHRVVVFEPEMIEEAAEHAARPVRPFDNAGLGSRYRKWMAAIFVSKALRRLAGDDI